MNDDDIDFPDQQTDPNESHHLSEDHHPAEYLEIKNPEDFESQSRFPIQLDLEPQKVNEDDLSPYKLESLDKKVLINEMSDYDMYLKNIHKGFKSVTSTRSLINLVAAGIQVHKHRRQVLNDIKNQKKASALEFDEYGNLKP